MRLNDRLDRRTHAGPIRYVTLTRQRLTACACDLVHDLSGAVEVQIDHGDSRALSRQPDRNRLANSSGRARHRTRISLGVVPLPCSCSFIVTPC